MSMFSSFPLPFRLPSFSSVIIVITFHLKFSIFHYFIDEFPYFTPHQTRIHHFPAVFMHFFMSSVPSMDPVQHLRSELRNDFRFFDILVFGA